MGTEIERKFLVVSSAWRDDADAGTLIRQGYLSTDPDRTVRVRLRGDRGTVTIKGRSVGARRAEFEWEIPAADATALLDTLALRPMIEKRRHLLRRGGHTWEIDVFSGANDGLVVAEVELDHEDDAVERPDWLGDEVTTDWRYSNASLVRAPFATW